MKNELNHTFVICAYKESPFLEECILSVLNQTSSSRVLIATSTDTPLIREMSEKYGLELRYSGLASDIAGDWNYAYHQADTRYVTIAHQDDVYDPGYAETAVRMLDKKNRPLLFFSDYYEIRDGQAVYRNLNLRIKKIMLAPLLIPGLSGRKAVKRSVLALGNPICCPSVTYVRDNLPYSLFRKGMKSNIDWQAWAAASGMRGDFVYKNKPLMGHRIHVGSTTTEIIESSSRTQEDLFMLKQFWPDPIAERINRLYQNAEKSNKS